MEGISVIICCYNSAVRLPKVLQYLSLQKEISTDIWEVLIIDNASTDETANLAIEEWGKYRLSNSLRVVYEPLPGLSHARKRGLVEALYDYVVFCDDDNWLFENYLSEAIQTMTSNPLIGALGGLGIPVFESKPPNWLHEFEGYYATGLQGEKNRISNITSSKKYIYGAGAVFKKSALLEIFKAESSLFLSDRTGTNLISGGDNEICYRLIMNKHQIYANSSMKFYHFLPKNRLTKKYLLSLNYSYGYSYCLLLPYLDYLNNIKRNRIKQWPLWLSFSLLKIFYLRHSRILMKSKEKINDIHVLMDYYYDLGMLTASFKNFTLLNKVFKFVRHYHGRQNL